MEMIFACLRRPLPLLSLLTALLASSAVIAGDIEVLPERATAVTVSNRDVNRVNCPYGISDVTWSKEKPVTVEQKGDNVMVKFLVRRIGTIETKVSDPVDVHVTCAGEVYTMILYPRDVDTQTIRLGDSQRRAVQSVTHEWGSLPLEEQVKKLTLAVYRNELPNGIERRPIEASDPRRHIDLFDNADIVGQSEVTAPGTGLRAGEYVVIAKESMTLKEKDFLARDFGDGVAITVDPLLVPKDGVARLIVINRGANNGQ